MSTTAGDQINGALRLIGQLAEAETPSAATAEDSLVALNQMIDSWNTERLSVFSTQDQVFSWTPGLITRTLGPTGDFVGNRPILIDDSTYFRDQDRDVYLSTGHVCKHDLPRHYNDGLPSAYQGSGMAHRVGAGAYNARATKHTFGVSTRLSARV